jgi:hypothetical protein
MARRYPDGDNQDERRAVRLALEETGQLPSGPERLALVQMVLIQGTHTLAGAAMRIPCSERTAQRYHADFLRAVGRNFHCRCLR